MGTRDWRPGTRYEGQEDNPNTQIQNVKIVARVR